MAASAISQKIKNNPPAKSVDTPKEFPLSLAWICSTVGSLVPSGMASSAHPKEAQLVAKDAKVKNPRMYVIFLFFNYTMFFLFVEYNFCIFCQVWRKG